MRRENVSGLLMSLNMLIEFGDAFDYSAADFREWCSEAGFTQFDVIHLPVHPAPPLRINRETGMAPRGLRPDAQQLQAGGRRVELELALLRR
jgi:hypothetical protein